MKRGHLSPLTVLAVLFVILLFQDGQGVPVHNWPGLLLVAIGAYWLLARM